MKTRLPLNQNRLSLPDIDLLESSEKAFADAFLKAAQISCRQLEQIKSTITVIEDFRKEPFNLAILGLFSKTCSHYYSYVLLEIHQDYVGSQLLLEHLCEAAVALTYLVEEVDKSVFSDCISASVTQAHYLLIDTEEQLQKFPNHSDLLLLKNALKSFILEQEPANVQSFTTCYWGSQKADTTAKRGAVIGLNFLCNPARQIALKTVPASWLDIQLNYSNFLSGSSSLKDNPGINFTYLRDATHLCLHAAQAFLEEVSKYRNVEHLDSKRHQQTLNVLYEWFYSAHRAYQLHCSTQGR